jgi:hypothetical protein
VLGKRHLVVDRTVIATNDLWKITEPVMRSAVFDNEDLYEKGLKRFSPPQRMLAAMCWYEAEVSNGGHHQFYFNSTGTCWCDALAGFEAARMTERAAILRESAQRLGDVPLDWMKRRDRLADFSPNVFSDLDDRFYNAHEHPSDAGLQDWIEAHTAELLFDGYV